MNARKGQGWLMWLALIVFLVVMVLSATGHDIFDGPYTDVGGDTCNGQC